eukprot:1025907-Pelagomonas_calceolata.AAC.2
MEAFGEGQVPTAEIPSLSLYISLLNLFTSRHWVKHNILFTGTAMSCLDPYTSPFETYSLSGTGRSTKSSSQALQCHALIPTPLPTKSTHYQALGGAQHPLHRHCDVMAATQLLEHKTFDTKNVEAQSNAVDFQDYHHPEQCCGLPVRITTALSNAVDFQDHHRPEQRGLLQGRSWILQFDLGNDAGAIQSQMLHHPY